GRRDRRSAAAGLRAGLQRAERSVAAPATLFSGGLMYRKSGHRSSFGRLGLAARHVFSQRAVVIAKPYPDSQLVLERRGLSAGRLKSGCFLQLNLYSTEFYDLPEEVFTEPQINWHGQQFGQRGLVAAGGLWIHNGAATITSLQSDLCQQLYRHPTLKASCKTRI